MLEVLFFDFGYRKLHSIFVFCNLVCRLKMASVYRKEKINFGHNKKNRSFFSLFIYVYLLNQYVYFNTIMLIIICID